MWRWCLWSQNRSGSLGAVRFTGGGTLRAGEAWRIRLATQIGSGLTAVLFVFGRAEHRFAPIRPTLPDRHERATLPWRKDRMAEALRINPTEGKARIEADQAIVLDVVSPLAWDQIDVACPAHSTGRARQ